MVNSGAIFGLIGSVLLAIPAARQELRRRDYADFQLKRVSGKKPASNPRLEESAKNYQIRESLRWSQLDSTCVLLGLLFLILSFIAELLAD
jgi:hypothetical protein